MIQTRAHAASLAEHVLGSDPQVLQRIQNGVGAVAGAVGDPALRAAQGAALLGQKLQGEANILAFNDVFRLVAALAVMTALYLFYRIAESAWDARRIARQKAEALA